MNLKVRFTAFSHPVHNASGEIGLDTHSCNSFKFLLDNHESHQLPVNYIKLDALSLP